MQEASAPAKDAWMQIRQDWTLARQQILAPLDDPNLTPRQGMAVITRLSRSCDAIMKRLWACLELHPSVALLAVGGYGRSQLFPSSDIDVLVLLPDHLSEEDQKKVEQFISVCWDVGLEIGSSVRTLGECLSESEKDITVQTALVESRYLCGSKEACSKLQKQLAALMDAPRFCAAKVAEMHQRHHKFENTPYSLEPNCKESPGGLRDLQVILWVAKAAGMGKSWKDLHHAGLISRLELHQIQANEAMISLIRARLHRIAKRREDRLVFDLQNQVAEAFGEKSAATPASTALMRRYYWAAKAVVQLNEIVMLVIEEKLNQSREGAAPVSMRPINERFFDRGGLIEVASDDLYEHHPEAILETFYLFQTEVGVTGLSARTLRALYASRSLMDARFRQDPRNRQMFLRILQAPQGITHAMRLLNQTSVLGRYLWPFRRTVGQMQHDLFHVYTVDQHILMVLRNVRRFFIADHSHEYPFCSQLAAGWDKPWVLFVAALFHDIAKGRGGDHSVLGAVEVRRFCKQHDIHPDDAKLIEFLVAEHLSMSQVAQKRDISDPDVLREFAQRVGNERYLTALYLLTVSDIRGTSPKVWNSWKGRLLEDLYRSTLRILGGRAPDPQSQVEMRKRDALNILALHALPHRVHEKLWDRLDVRYFMRHDADEIAWHARVISRYGLGADVEYPLVRARPVSETGAIQVMVYTPDQHDLFAHLCGYFDQAGFSIHDAKIHTTQDGFALDTFELGLPEIGVGARELTGMIESELVFALRDTGPLRLPSMGRLSRRVRSFPMPARVDLVPDERAQRWLLSVSASDRRGLLYCIARVLATHRIDMQLARITTLGERVEDMFLIEGPVLSSESGRVQIERELLEAIGT